MSLVTSATTFRATKMPAGPPEVKQKFVEDFLIRACDVMSIEGRDPDAWGVEHLCAAAGAILGCMYLAAVHYAGKAMSPPEERAEQYRDRNGAARLSRPGGHDPVRTSDSSLRVDPGSGESSTVNGQEYDLDGGTHRNHRPPALRP